MEKQSTLVSPSSTSEFLGEVKYSSLSSSTEPLLKTPTILQPVLETKEQLINTIKKWVKTDNEIRSLQKEINLRKKQKKI